MSLALTWSPAIPSFTVRSTQDEVLDAANTPAADYSHCLRDLASVNRITRTHAPILSWVEGQVARRPNRRLVLLDVGFGQGDLLRAIAQWAREHRVDLELHGVDLNPRSAAVARAATPAGLDIHYHSADVFHFSPPVTPDLVVSSQFAHHLDTPDLARLVRWMEATAREAWLIVDLERSAIAFHAFPLLCGLFGWHALVQRDGQVSIARALTAAEWRTVALEANVEAEVTRTFPFRLQITRASSTSRSAHPRRPLSRPA